MNLPDLSLSITEFEAALKPRDRLIAVAGAVTRDARTPGLRARERDRSARRDLAATLKRAELGLAGIDLWIPASHFVEAEHIDRAVAVGVGTIDLAAELASLSAGDAVVHLTLPDEGGDAAARALAAAAETAGVQLADHRWPMRSWEGPIAAGLDPAVALMEKADPVSAATSGSLVSARVSSLGDAAMRVALDAHGSRLDVAAYRASLSLSPLLLTLVTDVRGVHDAKAAALSALNAWEEAGQFLG